MPKITADNFETIQVTQFRAECSGCGYTEYGEGEFAGDSATEQKFIRQLEYYGWQVVDGKLLCKECDAEASATAPAD